jgi:hypothetical protein
MIAVKILHTPLQTNNKLVKWGDFVPAWASFSHLSLLSQRDVILSADKMKSRCDKREF